MHVTTTFKRARRDDGFDALLERERERIARRLAGVPLDSVSLHCEVDLNPHVREAYASLTLALPSGSLNARGVGANVPAALKDAVDELLVELKRVRQQQRRDARARQTLRPQDDEAFEAALAALEAGEPDLAPVIRGALPELHRFVRRELVRHREVLDRPECDAVDVADVVDEAVMVALAERAKRPPDVPFDRWLFTCAYDVVLREEERAARRIRRLSLDSEVQDGDGAADGEGILLERIRSTRVLADVLPDGEASPEAKADGRDLRLAVLRAVRQLPADGRKAFALVALEGLREEEAARRLEWPEERVQAALVVARDAVRQELATRGWAD